MTVLLSDQEVRLATDMPMLVDHLEKALRAEATDGGLLLPPRTNLNHADGFLRVMPVVMPGTGVLGLKMFHGSLERGVRYIVIVCDLGDGHIRAVVDAAYLTAARTGATSAVATRHLARHDASTVGLIGSGLEAETNLLGVCAVRDITHVKVYSRNRERRAAFAERVAPMIAAEIKPVDTPEEAVAETDMVVVATNTGVGGDVAFRGEWMERGQHVVSIGSTTPQLREIDVATFERADVAVFDATIEQVKEESGDVIALYADDVGWQASIQLVDVLTGDHPGRSSADQITLFKSVGAAVQDMAGAVCISDEAVRRGIGRIIPELAEAKLF